MKRKFISAMLFGALMVAPATTFVGCADYDDDIENLQGQITNNATTLDELTKEKIANVENEIKSLKDAQAQLKEAQEKATTDGDAATLAAATQLVNEAQARLQAALDAVNGEISDVNGSISALDARLAVADGKLSSVEALLAADGKITLAINDAQAMADKAYALAEQTAATANENKEAIKAAADNLKSIKESLEGQINTLSGKVNDLSSQLAEQNAALTAQIASLENQLKEAKDGNAANADKINANEGKISELTTQLNSLKEQVAANQLAVETLESNMLSKIQEVVNSTNTSINQLKEANAAAEERLTAAEGRLDSIDDLIASIQNTKADDAAIRELIANVKSELQNAQGVDKAALEQKINDLTAVVNGKASKDELDNAIANLKSTIENAQGVDKAALEQKISDLDSRIQTALNKKADKSYVDEKIRDLNNKFGELQASLDGLKKEDGTPIENFAEAIAAVQRNVNKVEGDISRIDEEIARIDVLVDVLFTDLSNLVTSLVLQENKFDAVWGQVNSANVATWAKDDQARKVYFPSKINPKDSLDYSEYTVEKVSGDMFLTINPTNIDFEKLKVDLRNSIDEASTAYTLTRAEAAENHLMTRATKSKNGLYHFRYKCVNTKPSTAPQASNVLYAASVGFPWEEKKKDSKKETVKSDRRVYSKYDLQFTPSHANAVTKHEFGIGFDSSVNTFEQIGSEVDIPKWNTTEIKGVVRPVANVGDPEAPFTVKLLLKTKNEKKVYAKYIECTNALNTNNHFDGNAVNAINKQSSAFKKVSYATLENDQDDPDFSSVTFDVNAYNGYTFSFDYYIWNYDGSVVKRTYTLTVTKPAIADQDVTKTVQPTSANDQTVLAEEFASKWCMTTKRSIWNEKATKFNVLPLQGANAGSIKSVTLTNADNTVDIVSCNYNSANKIALTNKNNIKNLKFTYNPTSIALNTYYSFKVVFYDANDHEVNTIKVHYKMIAPTSWNGEIIRGNGLFNDGVATFWALSETDNNGAVTAAYGDFSSIIANVNGNLDNMGSKILFKNTDTYSVANNNMAYEPLSGSVVTYNKFIVPFAAVDNNHIYNIDGGIEYFGKPNLWQAANSEGRYPEASFKVKFASRVLNAQYYGASATIPYGATTNVTGNNITAYDPSKGISNGIGTRMIFLGSNIDAQIKDVKVSFLDVHDKPLFSRAYLADANGNVIEDFLTPNGTTTPNNAAKADHIVLETKDKAAVSGVQSIKLVIDITDVFGHKRQYDPAKGIDTRYTITLNIDPNLTPSQSMRR